MNEDRLLKAAISEYKNVLAAIAGRTTLPLRSESLIRELSHNHDWTDSGARAVVSLAKDYGAFMLRNALGLAIALGKEDGELCF